MAECFESLQHLRLAHYLLELETAKGQTLDICVDHLHLAHSMILCYAMVCYHIFS